MSVKNMDKVLGIPQDKPVEETHIEMMSEGEDIPVNVMVEGDVPPDPVAAVDIQGYEEEINADDVYIENKLKGVIDDLSDMTKIMKDAMTETMECTGLVADSKDMTSFASMLNAKVNAVKQISSINEGRKKRIQKELSERRKLLSDTKGISFKTDEKGNVEDTDGGRKMVSRSDLIKAGKKNTTRGKQLLNKDFGDGSAV